MISSAWWAFADAVLGKVRRALHKTEGTSQQLRYPGARAPSNFTASGTSSSVSCDGCGVVHAEKLWAIWSKKKVRHLTVWCHMEISGALNNNAPACYLPATFWGCVGHFPHVHEDLPPFSIATNFWSCLTGESVEYTIPSGSWGFFCVLT